MIRLAISLACALSIVSTLGTAYADVTAYEGFDYLQVGDDASGQSGGSGFDGGWRTNDSGFDPYDIAHGSLTYEGLLTTGNRIRSEAASACCPGLFRDFASPISSRETTTKYLSFLLRPEEKVPVGYSSGWFGVFLDGTPDVFTGYSGTGGTKDYGIENFGRSLRHSTGVKVGVDEVALLVVKAELNPGTDEFTVYVNPPLGGAEPQSGTLKNDTDIGTLRGLGPASTGRFSIDEIRWGDTFSDVTPTIATSTRQIIGISEMWNYVPGTAEPSPFPDLAWAGLDFDDSGWSSVNGGLGYGSGVESRNVVTVLDDMKDGYSTAYLRKSFRISEPEELSHVVLELDYDDAFIAYINGVEVTRANIGNRGTPEPFDARVRAGQRFGSESYSFSIDLSAFPDLLRADEENILAIQGINWSNGDSDFVLSQISLLGLFHELTMLQAGDADQDLDFDQLDLVQVQVAGKNLTGQAATWGEGDWNGAPGGQPGSPPVGDGLFNQFDIIAAQQANVYLAGPYAAIQPNGQANDGQTSIVYDANTGELAVDSPIATELTSINIDSATGILIGNAAQNLGGSFDNDADNNIFKATFGGSFGSLSFGNVAQSGLSENFVLGDLSVVGSLAGGGDLGNVDLVYVPEPTSGLLLSIGLIIGLIRVRHARH